MVPQRAWSVQCCHLLAGKGIGSSVDNYKIIEALEMI